MQNTNRMPQTLINVEKVRTNYNENLMRFKTVNLKYNLKQTRIYWLKSSFLSKYVVFKITLLLFHKILYFINIDNQIK